MAGNVIEVVIRAKDEASGVFAKLSKTLGVPESILGKVAVAAGVATAAVGALAVGIKSVTDVAAQAANVGDAFNKMAQQTGLSVEELSRLKFAADQNESSIEAVAQAAKFLAKNLYEAQQGGAEQVATLKALGFSGAEAAGNLGTTGEALLKVSDKLKAIPDQGTRVALAMRLMGRGALEPLPLLQQGSEAIRQYGVDADRLGVTISTLAGKLGDDYNDAVAKVAAQTTGLKSKISEAVLPAMIQFQEALSATIIRLGAFVEENKTALASLADLTGKVFTVTLKFVVTGAEAAVKAFEFFQHFYDPLNAALASAEKSILEHKKNIDAALERNTGATASLFGGVKTGSGTTAPPPRVAPVKPPVDPKDVAAAREEAEKFDVALQRAYLVSETLGQSLRKTFGTKEATSLVTTINRTVEEANPDLSKRRGIEVDPKTGDALKEADRLAQEFGKSISEAADEVAKLDALDEIPPKLFISNEAGENLVATFEEMGLPVQGLIEKLAVIGPALDGVRAIGVGVGEALSLAFGEAFDPLKVGIESTFQAVGNLRQTFDGAFQSLSTAIATGNTGFIKLTNVVEGAARAVHRLVIELGLAIIKALILKAIGGFLGISAGGRVLDAPIGGGGGGGGFASRGGSARLASGGSVSVMQHIVKLASGGAVPAQGGTNIFQKIIHLATGGAVSNRSTVSYVSNPAHFATGGSVSNVSSATRNVAHFASGGAVSNVSTANVFQRIAHLATGGQIAPRIAALAAGGAIAAGLAFAAPVHASTGVRIIPGFPSARDSVPAILSPGEVVLPTIGGKSPANLLAELSLLSRGLSQVIDNRTANTTNNAAPLIENLHVHAFDADAVRNQARPGGQLERQLARSDELGRSQW